MAKKRLSRVAQAKRQIAVAVIGMSYADMLELASDVHYCASTSKVRSDESRPRDWAHFLHSMAQEFAEAEAEA